LPIECKSGRTISSDWVTALRRFEALAGERSEAGVIVHGGSETQTRGPNRILPWTQIDRLAQEV
jgi:hypothetical protein